MEGGVNAIKVLFALPGLADLVPEPYPFCARDAFLNSRNQLASTATINARLRVLGIQEIPPGKTRDCLLDRYEQCCSAYRYLKKQHAKGELQERMLRTLRSFGSADEPTCALETETEAEAAVDDDVNELEQQEENSDLEAGSWRYLDETAAASLVSDDFATVSSLLLDFHLFVLYDTSDAPRLGCGQGGRAARQNRMLAAVERYGGANGPLHWFKDVKKFIALFDKLFTEDSWRVYLHMILCEAFFMRRALGGLEQLSNQAVEAANGRDKTYYMQHTTKGGGKLRVEGSQEVMALAPYTGLVRKNSELGQELKRRSKKSEARLRAIPGSKLLKFDRLHIDPADRAAYDGIVSQLPSHGLARRVSELPAAVRGTEHRLQSRQPSASMDTTFGIPNNDALFL